MQAAGRLRLVGNGLNTKDARELYRDVYRWRGADWEIAAIREDRNTLCDFALSILPKGKRPEPVPADGEWMILHDHTGEHYLTDEDSTAVLHWEAWIDFQDRL